VKEAVWRTYKNILRLDKNNTTRVVDLGLVHSSAADMIVALILNRLSRAPTHPSPPILKPHSGKIRWTGEVPRTDAELGIGATSGG
jgi:hypothetical protein